MRPDFAAFFSGNAHIPGSEPSAHCYCGHQFGHFSGQLGDGATMARPSLAPALARRPEGPAPTSAPASPRRRWMHLSLAPCRSPLLARSTSAR